MTKQITIKDHSNETGMRMVYLEGVMMDNGEFVSNGKSRFLTADEIKKFVKEVV